jgi:hypothetical protein
MDFNSAVIYIKEHDTSVENSKKNKNTREIKFSNIISVWIPTLLHEERQIAQT